MKKLSIIYCVSFLIYIPRFFVNPYVTARLYADIINLIFILILLFQLLYIIFLRKKDAVSLPRAIARFFLYTTVSAEIILLIWYGNNFINGYTPTSFYGEPVGDTIYGFSAVFQDSWSHIIFVPVLFISIIYQVMYLCINKNMSRKSKDKS